MRIPKFRAWHKKSKKMLHIVSIEWDCIDEIDIIRACFNPPSIKSYIMDELELMQWTGFNDDDIDNPRDIYEGDLYNCGSQEPMLGKVIFNKEVGAYWLDFGDTFLTLYEALQEYQLEFAGTIYENGDLIEPKILESEQS